MAMLSVPTLAGLTSTVIFAVSTLPMLVKAHRSHDLASYSLGNIALSNGARGRGATAGRGRPDQLCDSAAAMIHVAAA